MNVLVDPELEVTTEQAARALEDGSALVVDIREPYEHLAGHIAGVRHIEMERLASRAGELPRDRPVIFHCRLGARSALAARAFRSAGFDAWSMAGGLEAWAAEGRPLEPEGGGVAPH